MTKLELIDKRKQLRARNKQLLATAQTEKRALNQAESEEFARNNTDIEEVNDSLDALQERGNPVYIQNPKEVRLSIGRILSAANNNTLNALNDYEKDFIKEGRARFEAVGVSTKGNVQIPISYRSMIDATTTAKGLEDQYVFDIATPLRDKSSLTTLGAKFIFESGLISLPSYSGSTFSWLGENEDAADGAGTFENLILANKRIAGVIPVSKQVLESTSKDVQGVLENDILDGIEEAINQAVFTFKAATTTKPAGIQAKTAIFTDALTQANVLALETALLEKNFKNIKYAVSPAMRAKLMSTVKGGAKSDLGFLIDSNGMTINGFPVTITTSASDATKALIFAGDFSQVYIKISALDILVDPFTLAGKNAIRLVVNVLSDIQYRNSNALVFGSCPK